MPQPDRTLASLWLGGCMFAAGASFYAAYVGGSLGHLATGIGFALLGFSWTKRPLAWLAVAVVLGGTVARLNGG